jgi:hypothetical protein
LCEKIKRLVVQAAVQVYHFNNNQSADDAQAEPMLINNDNNSSDGKDCSIDSPTTKRKTLFAYCEAASVLPKKMRIDIIQEINDEIMLFLKDQRYESDLIFIRSNHFPHLHQLALRVLCVPATSAPSERVFSRSGLIMRPHRSRLSKETLAKLTFVKCNIDLLS